MKLIVTEDTELVVDGQKVLLERGDQIMVNKKRLIQQLKADLEEAKSEGNTEKQESIMSQLYDMGVSI